MAYKQTTKDSVRAAYITGLGATDCARKFKIPLQTVRTWRRESQQKGDDWDACRAAQVARDSGSDSFNLQLISEFSTLWHLLSKQLKESPEIALLDKVEMLARMADAYSKVTAGFKRVNPHLSNLAVAFDVLKIIVDFLAQNDPRLSAGLVEHLDAVGKVLSRHFSKK